MEDHPAVSFLRKKGMPQDEMDRHCHYFGFMTAELYKNSGMLTLTPEGLLLKLNSTFSGPASLLCEKDAKLCAKCCLLYVEFLAEKLVKESESGQLSWLTG